MLEGNLLPKTIRSGGVGGDREKRVRMGRGGRGGEREEGEREKRVESVLVQEIVLHRSESHTDTQCDKF